jgi:hypothetical protein
VFSSVPIVLIVSDRESSYRSDESSLKSKKRKGNRSLLISYPDCSIDLQRVQLVHFYHFRLDPIQKIRETPRARPDKLELVSAPARTPYTLSIRQFETFIWPRAWPSCVPCRAVTQLCDSCRVRPDSILLPYRRIPPQHTVPALLCNIELFWCVFAVCILPSFGVAVVFMSLFLLLFILKCVHMAYFTTSFGSYSYSLSIYCVGTFPTTLAYLCSTGCSVGFPSAFTSCGRIRKRSKR